MRKTGKYRALRNIPVGWIVQAIHSTDRSEMLFRIFLEGFTLMVLIMLFWIAGALSLVSLLVSCFVVHTVFWFFTGNFWVYMLDSFGWVHNPGIPVILAFIESVRRIFSKTNSVDAILIYGSMCRRQFHGRSDLDLRAVRSRRGTAGLMALPVGFLMRVYSFFLLLPVDLQVVDSIDFLKKQMRKDEKPIVVFERRESQAFQGGMDFGEIMKNPRIILKNDQPGVV